MSQPCRRQQDLKRIVRCDRSAKERDQDQASVCSDPPLIVLRILFLMTLPFGVPISFPVSVIMLRWLRCFMNLADAGEKPRLQQPKSSENNRSNRSGAERQNRTVDTSLFRAVLCQLSYLGTEVVFGIREGVVPILAKPVNVLRILPRSHI